MSSCGHSTSFCFLPPTLTFLKENFASLPSDKSIDRSLLRCRLCDLIDTQYAADLAEIGPPYLPKEADIEKQIVDLKQAITEGTKTDTENALPKLQRKLSAAVRANDERILEVSGAESGEEDDFNIEFPPEETDSKTVVPQKPIPTKTISNKAMPENSVTKKTLPEKGVSRAAVAESPVPKKAALKKAAMKKTAPEEPAPRMDRKRKVAAKAESSPAETPAKSSTKIGRPDRRGKK
ncbi:hypothetical protein IFR04_010436 [Cadophora malorum]|uniref:Uncharacterized protein n=1 Tax=Cadophora malorum TaxID=108018 RepID=A0A8H7TC57_9HELO|nr:hypothetical protein IFR04_010436 [Cadophora malorum]